MEIKADAIIKPKGSMEIAEFTTPDPMKVGLKNDQDAFTDITSMDVARCGLNKSDRIHSPSALCKDNNCPSSYST